MKSLLSTKSKEILLKAKSLQDSTDDQIKLMLYGDIGTGKSEAIAGILRAGERVCVLSTEAGGNGLRSIRAALKVTDQLALLENLIFFEPSSYEETMYFLENFDTLTGDFKPTVNAWDGFTNFQTFYVSDYVLGYQYAGKLEKNPIEDMREAGLIRGEKDWDAIAIASRDALEAFTKLRKPDGGVYHVYLNCWEKDPVGDVPGRKISADDKLYRPNLDGKTRGQILGYFDYVFRSVMKNTVDGKQKFEYIVRNSESTTRERDRLFNNVEIADMEKVWTKIKTTHET